MERGRFAATYVRAKHIRAEVPNSNTPPAAKTLIYSPPLALAESCKSHESMSFKVLFAIMT